MSRTFCPENQLYCNNKLVDKFENCTIIKVYNILRKKMNNSNLKKARSKTIERKSQWRESLTAVMQQLNDGPAPSDINVGHRLQELRTAQGYSIRGLAELSGLNFNTLSLIENEKTSPNVNTLQQIASALQVPITAFFESGTQARDLAFQKAGERPHISFPHGELEDLGGGLALGEATPLLMKAYPKTDSGPDVFVHTGQEFMYCLEGSIHYFVGPEEYVLNPGDSLIFQAHIPHRWENHGESLAICILIICPEDIRDISVSQHLSDYSQDAGK